MYRIVIILLFALLNTTVSAQFKPDKYVNGKSNIDRIVSLLPDYTGKWDDFTSSSEIQSDAERINSVTRNLSDRQFVFDAKSNWEGLGLNYSADKDILFFYPYGHDYIPMHPHFAGKTVPKYVLYSNKMDPSYSIRGLSREDLRSVKSNTSLRFGFKCHIAPTNVIKLEKNPNSYRNRVTISLNIVEVYWKDSRGNVVVRSTNVK